MAAVCAAVLLAHLASAAARAQTVAAPPPTANAAPTSVPATTADDVIELSPFTVGSDRDMGYLAENTLAGSRLNARLRDTAGSVSVFTREFLDDLAITDISHLLVYTVNSESDTNEWQAGTLQNPAITGENLLNRTIIRGLAASQGLDYFTNITNSDPYRVARFDDTRGPNSILFGIGAPGGLLNLSSKTASVHRNSGMIRYSFGSWSRNRAEFDGNRVLLKDRLAMSVAAVRQDNGGWRQFDSDYRARIFGSVTYRPARSLTIQVMGETGHDRSTVIKTMPPTEEVLAWYDNRAARGVDAVTVTPTTALPGANLAALGISGRNGTLSGQNHRAVFIENNGTIFDAIGTYLTASYNNSAVRAPDGTPGVTASTLAINDPSFYPRSGNAGGPGMFRRQTLHNYTATADWQPTRNLTFNVAHHRQQTTLTSRILVNSDPMLGGDPNRTLGINGPSNPFAGRLYFDGNWRGDIHYGDYEEFRVSASYTLETRNKWLGRHRAAGSVSVSNQSDINALSWLSFVGRPFNAVPNNANNRVVVRNYITEGDYSTYRVGDWRALPTKFPFAGKTYDLAFVNDADGANNSGMKQEMNSRLAVVQSYFLNEKLVTTAGYRIDKVDVTQFGSVDDPVYGAVIVRDVDKAKLTHLTARTKSIGGVYHVTDWLSLIANRSSNVGVPPLARTIYPKGDLAPLSRGHGEDYGIGLDLLNGRVSARFTYFKAEELGRITSVGVVGAPGLNSRVMQAFGTVLVGSGLPYSSAQWDPIYKAYTPPANAVASDFSSHGYEARITTNLTKSWRLVANYSYTDSGRRNMAAEMIAWYGFKRGADGISLVQGVKQDATGRYVADPAAYSADGTIAKWIELGKLHPNANLSTLTTGTSGTTVAQDIFNFTNTLSDSGLEQEKRWGVRPHKASLFTAYDFKEGMLKGFTIGGGWHWRIANIIGTNSTGNEIHGRAIEAADMMMAYSWKTPKLPGRWRIQVNVSNLLNRTGIIPVRLATSTDVPDGFTLPGGRGIAYSRYDLVAPREIRVTTTYSF